MVDQGRAQCTADVEERARELEQKLRMIMSHATGGVSCNINQSTNDICVAISANRNLIYQAGKDAVLRTADAQGGLIPLSDPEPFQGGVEIRRTSQTMRIARSAQGAVDREAVAKLLCDRRGWFWLNLSDAQKDQFLADADAILALLAGGKK